VIAAVVLAAGAATRYGAPKQRLFLPRVLAALDAAGLETVVVVAGAHDLVAPPPAVVVRCADWERGPGASLRRGVDALPPETTHALVVLADGPDLDPRAIRRIAEHRDDGEVVAASYDGERSHPVSIARSAWAHIPDEGGRALDATLVACDDLTPPGDVDEPS
jgi:CTP:molybdopterin cytidylyltransferase MocA